MTEFNETVTTAHWRYCSVCGYMHESTTAGCPNTAANYTVPRQAVQPFACPVCKGGGVVHGMAEQGTMPTTPCHACNATGIVWGPPQ